MKRSALLVSAALALFAALPALSQQQASAPMSGPISFYPRTSIYYLGDAMYDVKAEAGNVVVSITHGDKSESFTAKGEFLQVEKVNLDQGIEVLIVAYERPGPQKDKWVIVLSEIDFMRYLDDSAKQLGIKADFRINGPINVAKLEAADADFKAILGMPASNP